MKMVFKGYGDSKPYYGIGNFTVGNTYEIVQGPEVYQDDEIEYEDAQFLDDNGTEIWEDTKYFSEVDKS